MKCVKSCVLVSSCVFFLAFLCADEPLLTNVSFVETFVSTNEREHKGWAKNNTCQQP